MRLRLSAVAATALLALAGCGAAASGGTASGRTASSGAQRSAGYAPAVRATSRLALALLPRLGGTGNALVSPYSIEVALAMVDQGARGATAAQLASVLGEPDRAALAEANLGLVAQLHAHAPRLQDANGLWVQSGLPLRPAFTGTLAANFGGAPQVADFAHGPDTARAAINAWVTAHTANLIRDLMPPGSITARTALVLANAIHLVAKWQDPFDRSLTAPLPFHPDRARTVSVPFMAQRPPASLPYAAGRGWRAVELPYRSSKLSLLAVMPAPGTIASFERMVNLARITAALRTQPLTLRMPKLDLALHAELNATLAALGMPLAFSDQADLSGITARMSLKIEAVEHAAVLKVDEAGTVAAAATGISIEPTAIAAPPRTSLTLDHPFLLFLRDDQTGTILFAARVANPAA